MISIKNLTKEFSGQKVLDGIDIDIEKGEVVALVGASGAGKSTILRSLNYLEQPDSGTITIDDFKVDFKTITKEQILTLRRKLAMVFQQFNLFERRTALDNVKEGLLNYLSLLGWSLSADQDVFSVDDLVAHFDIHDVVGNPARFDVKKAEAINGDHIRRLEADDFRNRLVPYLQAAGVVGEELSAREEQILTEAAPLVQERMQLLGEAPKLLAFLFKADEEITVADDARKQLKESAPQVLAAALEALEPLEVWDAASIESALRSAIVEGLEIKPRLAFGPVRIAVSGERISPPLFESMEILGKESSLNRVRALAAELGA